jgi:hypothetical protein
MSMPLIPQNNIKRFYGTSFSKNRGVNAVSDDFFE